MTTPNHNYRLAGLAIVAVALLGQPVDAQAPLDNTTVQTPRRHSDQDGCGADPLGFVTNQEPAPKSPLGRTLFVDARATGLNNGRCWVNAFDNLQDALDRARQDSNVTEIWVARGTYLPDRGSGDRALSFDLVEGVRIYGGFAGTETARWQRNNDPLTNLTVLSGDLLGDDATGGGRTDNSFHVVSASGVTRQTILDGFTISGGWADGPADLQAGGGLYLAAANPTIRRCLFYDNAAYQGGAVYALAAGPKLRYCGFLQNTAVDGADLYASAGAEPDVEFSNFIGGVALQSGGSVFAEAASPLIMHSRMLATSAIDGGAVYGIAGSNPILVNCVVTACSASGDGGAVTLLDTSGATLVNSTIAYNSAGGLGGGINAPDASLLTIDNTILWGNTDTLSATPEDMQLSVGPGTVAINYSCVDGWTGQFGGVGNIDRDPLFVNPDGTAFADLSLSPGSPAIDAADSDAFSKALNVYRGQISGFYVDVDELERFVDDPETPDTGSSISGLPVIDIGASEFALPVAPGGATGGTGNP